MQKRSIGLTQFLYTLLAREQKMTDIAITVFRFSNRRRYSVPPLKAIYEERDTDQVWQINCGGTRGYFARYRADLLAYDGKASRRSDC